jgi:pyridinium-3,5-bisthiocarboxylic acid mononucleotide nickel chelatase
MKTIHFDSIGGASGDMILAALVDLGAPLDKILAMLKSLNLPAFEISTQKVSEKGITGLRLHVKTPHEHTARGLPEIRKILSAGSLPEPVRTMTLRVFERLAEVEGAIHSKPAEEVHFHEIGAMDSILDITGACMAIHLLDADSISFSTLPEGTGTTNCAHGVLPIPVPAVAALLKGYSIRQTSEPFELVTPTGAALLTVWNSSLPPKTSGTATILRATGTGAGHRTLNTLPNLLRAMLLDSNAPANQTSGECAVLECNLDDMTPELVGYLHSRLMKEGALDVFTAPVFMKKQRPGILLTVLAALQDKERLMSLIFTESTTFGIRCHTVQRTMLERRHENVTTRFGTARVKLGILNGKILTRSPEYEDCARLAEAAVVPLKLVYEEIERTLDPIQ